jgi:PTH2 family peptidyl-tRNA hydrolase
MIENTKQVIVWRNDLKVRTGKIGAQCSHASMAFLTKNGCMVDEITSDVGWGSERYHYFSNNSWDMIKNFDELNHWLKNSFRKIVCYVNNEKELLDLHQKALEAGLISHLITDNGATEFGGIHTNTCLGIGPHWDYKFEGITNHLPLL